MCLAGFTLLQVPEISQSAKFHEKMKGLGGILCCVGGSCGCEDFNTAKTKEIAQSQSLHAQSQSL